MTFPLASSSSSAEMSWWRGDAILRGWWQSDAVLRDMESAYLRGGWRADDVLLGGAVTDEMLGVGKQRGRAVQRDEMSIGYNEIEVGVGVDQGWFVTVLPEVLQLVGCRATMKGCVTFEGGPETTDTDRLQETAVAG